ncbi:peptidylprolyl isomerase, partial [Chloroflexota bacterium]
LPNNAVHRDIVRTQLLISKLLDEYFDPQIPVHAEQRHVMAMLVESKQQATEVRARLDNGESFTELAEELSLEFYSKANEGDFGWIPKDVLHELLGTSIVDNIFSAEVGVLSRPIHDNVISKGLGYWLVRVLDRNEEEEETHLQVMLLSSEEEAKDITARLEAGEDFATLAKDFSQLEGVRENEGEYMVSPSMMSPAVEEFAFDPEVGLETISEPILDETITTKGGYWLIKVVAEDKNREIENEDRDLLKSKALDEWVTALWLDPENKVDDTYLDEAQKAWAIEQAMKP